MKRTRPRDDDNQHQQQSRNNKDRVVTEVPVSLGKPSLRLRLEAYYAHVAPEQIADATAWRTRYDQIYAKYGGTVEGEAKLASQLRKKYGSIVTLQLTTTTTPSTTNDATNSTQQHQRQAQHQYDEAWYELRETELNSGVVVFTSNCFDPVAALRPSSVQQVLDANPRAFVAIAAASTTHHNNQTVPIFERVEQCCRLLPRNDPLHRIPRTAAAVAAAAGTSSAATTPKSQPLSCFALLAEPYEKGPLSLLYRAWVARARIRVLIRYPQGIRGTVTGQLLAFDKHCNLLLRNVDEVYSRPPPSRSSLSPTDPSIVVSSSSAPMDGGGEEKDCTVGVRGTDTQTPWSPIEMELARRQGRLLQHQQETITTSTTSTTTTTLQHPSTTTAVSVALPGVVKVENDKIQEVVPPHHRKMRQVLLRGDNVVMVYWAAQEQSAWPISPPTTPSTTTPPLAALQSRYRCRSVPQHLQMIPPHERVGTPGSLLRYLRRPKIPRGQRQPAGQRRQHQGRNIHNPNNMTTQESLSSPPPQKPQRYDYDSRRDAHR